MWKAIHLVVFQQCSSFCSKIEREKSAGTGWFNMPAPEMTPELQRDLNIIRMRGVLDPKRHYKKETSKKLPKYVQVTAYVGGAKYWKNCGCVEIMQFSNSWCCHTRQFFLATCNANLGEKDISGSCRIVDICKLLYDLQSDYFAN